MSLFSQKIPYSLNDPRIHKRSLFSLKNTSCLLNDPPSSLIKIIRNQQGQLKKRDSLVIMI